MICLPPAAAGNVTWSPCLKVVDVPSGATIVTDEFRVIL
jgi:hypothetical protein